MAGSLASVVCANLQVIEMGHAAGQGPEAHPACLEEGGAGGAQKESKQCQMYV
jgi:hypothetical protein